MVDFRLLARSLALVLLLALRCSPGDGSGASLQRCGRSAHSAQAMATPAAAAPWIAVHPERRARLAGVSIHGVCTSGTPPLKLAGEAPALAPGSPFRRFGGSLVAHCLIDDEGYVVEVQVLKTPHRSDQLAVAQALTGWRFAPARIAGRPIALHFIVLIRVPRDR